MSVPAAFARADAVTSRSPTKEIVLVLDSLHNGTLVPRLLTGHGVEPVRAWLHGGGDFSVLAREVFNVALEKEVGSIYSWEYFTTRIADVSEVGM